LSRHEEEGCQQDDERSMEKEPHVESFRATPCRDQAPYPMEPLLSIGEPVGRPEYPRQ
jgi:hypothetical protein